MKAVLAGALLVTGMVAIGAARPAAADTCVVGFCGWEPTIGFRSDVVTWSTATDGYGLNAQCAIGKGVADTNGVQYSVFGDATATGGVANGIGMTCLVVTNTGWWGGASNGGPGGATAAAGLSWRIPLTDLAGLRVCAYANTIYNPNSPSETRVQSGCPVL